MEGTPEILPSPLASMAGGKNKAKASRSGASAPGGSGQAVAKPTRVERTLQGGNDRFKTHVNPRINSFRPLAIELATRITVSAR